MKIQKTQQGKVLTLILAIIIIGAAVGGAKFMMQNKPKAEKKVVEQKIPVVQINEIEIVDHQVKINAMGNVTPAKSITLTAQVKGQVVKTHKNFVPGGKIKKGQTLVTIDPQDYELTILQRTSDLETAKNNLAVEMGKQQVAKNEYELLGAELSEQDQQLILRKPQLKAVEASVRAAESRLKLAKLDLQRSRIKAPFDAIIETKKVDSGSFANVGSALATLISTEQYWIEVNIPMDRLSWLQIPEFNANKGSTVLLSFPSVWGEQTRSGVIRNMKANIDQNVRMAQLIIEVDDPLSLKKSNAKLPKMIMGAFMQVSFQGKSLEQVIRIPRDTLRDGNTVWLIDEQDKLKIVKVDPLWKNAGYVFFNPRALPQGHAIISSNLSTPVNGMQLKVKE